MATMESCGIMRRNISIPIELNKRMDQVADRVNWSAVAQQAFEVHLEQIDGHSKPPSAEAVYEAVAEALLVASKLLRRTKA